MRGKLPPDIVKPAPATVAELIVTGAVPVEDKITARFVAVFTATFPNAMYVALMLSAGVYAFNCRANVLDVLPAAAVKVTDCAVVTEATVAVKAVLVELAGTVTVAGTVTAALLLERIAVKPPDGAAEVSVTVQASVPEPVMDELTQVSPLSAAVTVPLPVRARVEVPPPAELLEMVNCPVAAPADAGSNCTVKVVVCPGVKVRGKLAPETEKPVPVAIAELTATGAVPVEDRTTDWLVAVFTATLPKATLAALIVNVGV